MYLEGMEEASIFVHVAVNDITSKVSTSCGLQAKNMLVLLCAESCIWHC